MTEFQHFASEEAMKEMIDSWSEEMQWRVFNELLRRHGFKLRVEPPQHAKSQ